MACVRLDTLAQVAQLCRQVRFYGGAIQARWHPEVKQRYMRHIAPPQIGQSLGCIAGLGQDQTGELVQFATQRLVQRRSHDPAHEARQVHTSPSALIRPGEDEHRVKPCGVEQFLWDAGGKETD
jgi:hypothetical protein